MAEAHKSQSLQADEMGAALGAADGRAGQTVLEGLLEAEEKLIMEADVEAKAALLTKRHV